MSNNVKRQAYELSKLGRKGDSELVHVTPDELNFLQQIGSGTINPDTGLYEFFPVEAGRENEIDKKTFGEAFAEKRNELGAGQTFTWRGTSYSTNYAEEDDDKGSSSSAYDPQGRGVLTEEERQANRENSFLGLDRDGDGSMWTTTDEFGVTRNFLGQEMNIVEGVNDGYLHGALDVDGDGSFLTANNRNRDDRPNDRSEKTNDSTWGERFQNNLFTFDPDKPFRTILNTVGLIAAPIPTMAGAGLMATFDQDNDGNPFNDLFSGDTTSEQTAETMKRHQEFLDRMKERRNDRQDEERYLSEVEELVSEEEVAASDSATAETDLSDLKFTINGNGTLPFMDYIYTVDGKKQAVNYDGQPKPFRLFFGNQFQNDAYVNAEKARNGVMEMVAGLPLSMQDNLKGDISVRMGADGNLNLYVGDTSSGFIEATYTGDNAGYQNLMSDVKAMVQYTNDTGDTQIDSGYLGRLTSHKTYSAYTTQLLQQELINLRAELENTTNPRQIEIVTRKMANVETELRRRNGETLGIEESVNGLTDQVAATVSDINNVQYA